jgi:methionyl-tRNA formyltransferase
MSEHDHPTARIVLFGMRCAFTQPVLEALIAAPGVEVAALVLPEPIAGDDPFAQGTPTIGVPSRAALDDPDVQDRLHALTPDLVVVACFPWRLPGWLLALPARAGVNIHPSLLPDGRGPAPVFWAFRWGLAETGVSLHVLDAGFDTGPVIAQRRLAIPPEATLPSLELTLVWIGAGLLIEHLPAILNGAASPIAQRGEPARYAPLPRAGDLLVTTDQPAREAARFIRAVTPVHGPVPVLVRATGQRLAVAGVLDVRDDTIPQPLIVSPDVAAIRFSPGTLSCRLATTPRPLHLLRAQ